MADSSNQPNLAISIHEVKLTGLLPWPPVVAAGDDDIEYVIFTMFAFALLLEDLHT